MAANDAFDAHYRQNFDKVYRLALALVGNRHDAQEVTQEAFCRAYRAFASFREESSFATWVFRITVNAARSHMRRRHKMVTESLTEDFGLPLDAVLDRDPPATPETTLLAHEIRVRCLFSITECLAGDQRRVFCLAVTLGLPLTDVAQVLGWSMPKVKTTLHRARRKWLGYMDNRCSLIKRSNPCRCEQWVRFARERGWIGRGEAPTPMPEASLQALADLRRLQAMARLYRSPDMTATDPDLCERLRQGMAVHEWRVLSG